MSEKWCSLRAGLNVPSTLLFAQRQMWGILTSGCIMIEVWQSCCYLQFVNNTQRTYSILISIYATVPGGSSSRLQFVR